MRKFGVEVSVRVWDQDGVGVTLNALLSDVRDFAGIVFNVAPYQLKASELLAAEAEQA